MGLGKIARDQHIPAVQRSGEWELAATVSRSGSVEGVENYPSVETLLKARPDVRVLSLCAPPAPRFAMAAAAIAARRDLMLEKPPGATLTECAALRTMAGAAKVSLFAAWHSREAECVDQARDWLADKAIRSIEIRWKEDVRRWHSGQEWIWEPGGFGVFDPGINSLAILTKILPVPVRVTRASLVFPANRQTPIAARLEVATIRGARGDVEFDWREEGDQIWEIRIMTDTGELRLSDGGATLRIDGEVAGADTEALTLTSEYPRLYRAMRRLVEERRSDMDLRPLQLVADAFLVGRREWTDPFAF